MHFTLLAREIPAKRNFIVSVKISLFILCSQLASVNASDPSKFFGESFRVEREITYRAGGTYETNA